MSLWFGKTINWNLHFYSNDCKDIECCSQNECECRARSLAPIRVPGSRMLSPGS